MASISGQVKSGIRGALDLYRLRIGFDLIVDSALYVIGSDALGVSEFLNHLIAMSFTFLKIWGCFCLHHHTLLTYAKERP